VSTLAVNTITNAAGGNTAQINGMTPTADSLQGFRNRLINSDMRIDQRNAGASVTPTNGQYGVDRWQAYLTQASKFSMQQSSTAPAGFKNSLLVTSLSAYSVVSGDFFNVLQFIEGFNVADLDWGTANAKTVTLSFWVRSSLTGTFGGVLRNTGGGTRSYPFSYTISVADTWEQKTITVPGDTTGSWNTTNGQGIGVVFDFGVGATFEGTAGAWANSNLYGTTGATSVVATSGATFYITGVQLEAGSVATPFERRPYGTELALCQRYYCKLSGTNGRLGMGYNATTTEGTAFINFPVTMRNFPSALEQSGTASDYGVQVLGSTGTCSSVPTFQGASTLNGTSITYFQSGLVAGQGGLFGIKNTATAFIAFSAEL
jgi:hypothetical protein